MEWNMLDILSCNELFFLNGGAELLIIKLVSITYCICLKDLASSR